MTSSSLGSDAHSIRSFSIVGAYSSTGTHMSRVSLFPDLVGRHGRVSWGCWLPIGDDNGD
jgi:hypothetical protein